MTQEEKQLLLIDLCARLPYGVKCQMEDELIISDSHFYDCNLSERYIELFRNHKDFYIKPYLRPMSSMTEEEKNELKEYLDAEEVDCNGFGYSEGGTLEDYISSIPYSICDGVVNWLNKKMFDYRGLIPKGLALEVTEDNNPYKEIVL